MFNWSEILTITFGIFLSLIFIDGIRRSVRIGKNKLKENFKTSSILEKRDSENLSENLDQDSLHQFPLSKKDQEDNKVGFNVEPKHKLLIVNLSSKLLEPFSHTSLSDQLSDYRYNFEKKGFFTFRDNDDSVMFSLLNAKNPGTFIDNNHSADIALILDPDKTQNAVEAFDLMCILAESLSQIFSCSLLDENRNILTKQMLEHMRNETQEYRRQHLASVN